MRLYPKTEVLIALNNFLASKKFNTAIAQKFNINIDNCDIDGGIQKYLDGYEISPHPDIRRKAATFMVNINPHKASERYNHHTHYLKLKTEYNYVKEFWETSSKAERHWVPWDWCDTSFMQTKNNSIVLFSPSNDTMHGVKAVYDHLVSLGANPSQFTMVSFGEERPAVSGSNEVAWAKNRRVDFTRL